MWTKFLTAVLTDERVQRLIVRTLVAAIAVLFILFYAVIATPWTMLTGWFDSLFGGHDIWDGVNLDAAFAAQNQEAYIENYEQFSRGHISTLEPHYHRLWDQVDEKSHLVAKELGTENAKTSNHPQDGDPCCGAEWEAHSIVYSTFFSGVRNGQYDAISIMDAGVIMSYFNNVGLAWDFYKDNYPDVLRLMNVPTDPVSGEPIGELSSVQADKLVSLIRSNAARFFVAHIPKEDGSCSLGGECRLNHAAKFVDVGSRDNLPETYQDLVTNTALQEPYFGVYYSQWCSEHEHSEDTDGDGFDDSSYDCHTYHTDYTAVGFVEYRGFEWFEEYLHLDEVPGAQNRVSEAYSNLRDILGIETSAEYSLQIDAILQNYEPTMLRFMRFPGVNGSSTALPIYQSNGDSFPITATFNDAGYQAALGYAHWGVDFAAPIGTTVRATSRGIVVLAQSTYTPGKGFGRYVVIYQGSNAAGDRYFVIYAHLNSISVAEGSMVSAGSRIGASGNTGNSTGPHLHYEVRVARANGTIESIDPFSAEGGALIV